MEIEQQQKQQQHSQQHNNYFGGKLNNNERNFHISSGALIMVSDITHRHLSYILYET